MTLIVPQRIEPVTRLVRTTIYHSFSDYLVDHPGTGHPLEEFHYAAVERQIEEKGFYEHREPVLSREDRRILRESEKSLANFLSVLGSAEKSTRHSKLRFGGALAA
jgi:hypothetical protein